MYKRLTPLLFLILLVATAPRGTRRHAWWNGWVVYVPAVAGIVAYSLVLVTARYVMPFLLAGMLTLLATLPRPRRMLPLMAMLGIAIPIGLESTSNDTVFGLALVAAAVAAMTIGALVPTTIATCCGGSSWSWDLCSRRFSFHRPRRTSFASGRCSSPCSSGLRRVPPFAPGTRSEFAHRATAALALVLTMVFGLRLERRLRQDANALSRAASTGWGNVQLKIAQDLAAHGIGEGTPIALIGPHAESYWARAGRLKIVANVPRTRVSAFWQLSPASRDSLLQAFAAAGATVAVASMGPDGASPDSSWTPVRYRGWIRRLSPA